MKTQKEVIHALGQDAVLWISPSKISKTISSKYPVNARFQRLFNGLPRFIRKYPKYYLRSIHPFVIPAERYGEAMEIECDRKYIKIKNFITNLEDVEASDWYADLMVQIQQNAMARHKKILMKNKKEVLSFLNHYVVDLIQSMRSAGYNTEKAQDYSTVLIGPSGELHKSGSGNHRFMVAKLVGVKRYPVKVMGVHQTFLQKNNLNIRDVDFVNRFREILFQIEREYVD